MSKLKRSRNEKAIRAKEKSKPKSRVKPKQNLKSGLDGWLVLWRMAMDDLPVALFSTEAAAIKYAKTIQRRECVRIADSNDFSITTHFFFFVCHFKAGKLVSANQIEREDDGI